MNNQSRALILIPAIALSLAQTSWALNQHKQNDQNLDEKLKSDIQTNSRKTKGSSFEALTQAWEKQYGTRAFQPLIRIASDRKQEDSTRYIALMSATKLGGSKVVPVLLLFLKDPSWMIRSGTLRVLSSLGDSQTGKRVIPLLRDPALVVRAEAVEAIKLLKPEGAADALVSTLDDENNYHGGKAQWVPQKVLEALVTLKAKEISSKLNAFLGKPFHRNDPDFRRQLAETAAQLSTGP